MYRAADPRSDPATMELGAVYVLHFSEAVGTKKQQARHYVGWASDPDARIQAHREGRGGKLTAHAVKQGVTLEVAVVHQGVTRDFERRLKNRGGAARHCPICRAASPRHGVAACATARKGRREVAA